MHCEDYFVGQFKQAWFKKDRSVISEEIFPILQAEYLDISGLFLSDDFEKQAQIYNIDRKLSYVKTFIRLQRDYIEVFKMPFQRDFHILKNKYGYVLKWKGDLEDFKSQLLNIERREIKNTSYLDMKIQELKELRAKQGRKTEVTDDDLLNSRHSFLRMQNSLGKVGYKIDDNSTTVESFALMIKQQLEDQDEIRSQRYNGR